MEMHIMEGWPLYLAAVRFGTGWAYVQGNVGYLFWFHGRFKKAHPAKENLK